MTRVTIPQIADFACSETSRVEATRHTRAGDRSATQRVDAALPDCSRRARGQAEWLRAVEACPDVTALRVDALEHVRAIAWALACTASWSTLTTRPTWPLLEERSGLSRRTVARWLAWLRAAGLLGVVESGTTPQFRPMALSAGEGNRAAVYVLAIPAATEVVAPAPAELSTAESGTPTWLLLDQRKDPNAGAREETPGPLRGPDLAEIRNNNSWPRTRAASSRHERLALVRRLQREAPALRQLTDRALRHLLRPWLLAGWTVAELMHALDHEPNGTERTWTTAVRSPGGWLLSRLQLWTITPEVACSPPSVALRAAESAEQAKAERQRADAAAAATARDVSMAFGRRLEDVAGPHLYAGLVEVVIARQFTNPSRIFAAAGALVRLEIRTQLCPSCQADDDSHEPCRALIATDAELLGAANHVLTG